MLDQKAKKQSKYISQISLGQFIYQTAICLLPLLLSYGNIEEAYKKYLSKSV